MSNQSVSTAGPHSAAATFSKGRGVQAKILYALGAVALAAAAVAGISLSRLHQLDGQLSRVSTTNIESISDLSDIRGAMALINHWVILWNLSPNAEGKALAKENIIAADAALNQAYERYVSHAQGAEAEKAAGEFIRNARAFSALRNGDMFKTPIPADLDIPAKGDITAIVKGMDDGLVNMIRIEKTNAAQAAADGHRQYNNAVTLVLTAFGVALLLSISLGVLVARRITGPLGLVTRALLRVAGGDLTQRVEVKSRDEIGVMAAAMNEAAGSVRQAITDLAETAETLNGNAAQLKASSDDVRDSAQRANNQVGVVAGAAEEVSRSVQVLATGSDELESSIREIALSANEGAKVAGQAVEVANETSGIVEQLGDSSTQISSVVKVITSIAEQTNLLALNATIEAARAGDAGKGFAVVAGEVKDLAQETAKATEDISRRVEAIQADTNRAVHAIGQIGEIIGRINEYQITIATAVEEQTATTNEMNRNVAVAAAGSAEIAVNISDVADIVRGTTDSVDSSAAGASGVAQLSTALSGIVSRFRV